MTTPRLSAVLALVTGILAPASTAQDRTVQERVQEKTQIKTHEKVIVVCEDKSNRPVGDVEVHLYQCRKLPDGRSDYRSFGPYRTDPNGRVRCPVALTFHGGCYDRIVYAQVADKLVGGGRSSCFNPGAKKASAEKASIVHVRLVPSRTMLGKVTVPEGYKPDQIRVKVMSLYALDGKNQSSFGGMEFGTLLGRATSLPGLERILPEIFECRAAADGTFTLRDVPAAGRLYLACEGSGLAHAQWANVGRGAVPLPKSIEITMSAESSISGRLQGPDGVPVPRAAVSARIAASKPPAGIYVLSTFRTKTDEKGGFRIAGLPLAEFELHTDLTNKAWVVRPRKLNSVQASKGRKDVLVKVVRAVEIKGVVSGADGPVERAGVIALTEDDLRMASCMTDSQGRFTLYLPPGPAKLYFGSVPRGYAFPEPQIVTELQVDAQKPPKTVRLWLDRKDR